MIDKGLVSGSIFDHFYLEAAAGVSIWFKGLTHNYVKGTEKNKECHIKFIWLLFLLFP